ncbi:hypothetical protein M514_00913 [Trichuris suis]|uniref:Uncharacterized protein n=1 Tax=Trichuris suis TaxID=68888 RepID=A0A085MYU5_9BILA|nr:hypothetical protein M513_00913 [Trichuris suis]KFD62391.1 hypothetical protein M514_00913 [Trichuris suis]
MTASSSTMLIRLASSGRSQAASSTTLPPTSSTIPRASELALTQSLAVSLDTSHLRRAGSYARARAEICWRNASNPASKILASKLDDTSLAFLFAKAAATTSQPQTGKCLVNVNLL